MTRILILLSLLVPALATAQTPEETFQRALRLERTQGDYAGAISLYESIARDADDRHLGARALDILAPLTRFTVFLLGLYLALKVGDMVVRGTYAYLLDGTAQTNSFLIELVLGVVVPWIMLVLPKVRQSRRGLFIACALIVGGVLVNRANVFVVGYRPPISEANYAPAFSEILITVGLIAGLMFLYRFFVTYLPVLNRPKQEVSA